MNHNKEKKYYEYLAKLLLEQFLPDDYSNLELSDKPDLRMGEDHGIEVTRAMFPDEGKVSGIFEHIKMQPLKEADQRKIRTIERLGYGLEEVNGAVLSYYPKEAFWVSNQELETIFLQKLKKFSHYNGYSTVDIFIFSPMFDWYDKESINEFMMWADEKNNGRFSCIIVYDENYIYSYHTGNKKLNVIPIEQRVLHDCCVKAKKYAIECKLLDIIIPKMLSTKISPGRIRRRPSARRLSRPPRQSSTPGPCTRIAA